MSGRLDVVDKWLLGIFSATSVMALAIGVATSPARTEIALKAEASKAEASSALSKDIAALCPSYTRMQIACEIKLSAQSKSPQEITKACTAPALVKSCNLLLDAGAASPGMDATLHKAISQSREITITLNDQTK